MRYSAVLLIPIAIVGVSLVVGNESDQMQPALAPVNPAPVPVPVNPDSVPPHEL